MLVELEQINWLARKKNNSNRQKTSFRKKKGSQIMFRSNHDLQVSRLIK